MGTAPVFRLPGFERQLVVATDASDVSVGVILEQDLGMDCNLWHFPAES